MGTPPLLPAASDSWGRRDRKTEGKDLAIDLKSGIHMHDSLSGPVSSRPEGPLER